MEERLFSLPADSIVVVVVAACIVCTVFDVYMIII